VLLAQLDRLPAPPTAVDRFLNLPLFTIGQTPVTPMTVLTALLIFLFTLFVARLAQRGARRGFATRGVTDQATIGVVTRLLSYGIVLMGTGVALQTVGVNLAALFAAGAFFAIALGFAMQNIAQNFVGGLILLAERTIKPGDLLEVEGRFITVSRIGLRATVGRSRDEEDLIIPNAVLVQNTVTNYTLRDTVRRVRVSVGVSYDSDLRVVKQVLRDTAAAFGERLPDYEPSVLLGDFGDSAVLFEVSVWISDPWRARVARSELSEAIWWALKGAGITIPFPQRVVHMAATPEARPPEAGE
jgi:small-conductance mechanosensitive channel